MNSEKRVPEQVINGFGEVSKLEYHTLPKFSAPLSQEEFRCLLNEGKHDVIPLNIHFPYENILEEFERCQKYLVPHKPLDKLFFEWRQRTGLPEGHWKINPTKSSLWQAMCLFGLGARKTKDPDFYTDWQQKYSEPPTDWTEIALRCERTVNFFKSLPLQQITRIRLSRLGPQGYIGPHQDSEAPKYFLNFALNMPKGCYFKLAGKLVPFTAGRVFLLNISKMHELINRSDEDRIHMIVNCKDLYRLNDYL